MAGQIYQTPLPPQQKDGSFAPVNTMSDHGTDSEESYQSDNSNINFISGYILECSKRENSSNDSSDEDENNLAYADEPLASEEWLENYNRQENERLELEEKLRKRLDGTTEVSEW